MRVCDGISYEIIRTRRKTIGLKINDGKLEIHASTLVPIWQIENAIREKKSWILKHLNNPLIKIKPSFQQGCDMYLMGKRYVLDWQQKREKGIRIEGDVIHISGSSPAVVEKQWLEFCRSALIQIMEKIKSDDHSNFFTAVSYDYRVYKRRWGCCNKLKRLIIFNIYCAGLPFEAIRYIYYHEHAHLTA